MSEVFVPLSPSMLANPYPIYSSLRDTDPVHWHNGLAAWVLTRYADCARVLKQHDVFSADPRRCGKPMHPAAASIQALDAPAHGEIRRPLLASLRRLDLTAWQRELHQLAGKAVAVASRDGFDLVSEIAEPLALRSMCRLYDVPLPEDEQAFHQASQALVLGMDGGLAPERVPAAIAGRVAINEEVERWYDTADSDGWLGEVRGTLPTQHHRLVINSLRAIFHAGYSSTSSLLGNIVKWLAEHDDLGRDSLRGVDERTVNELCRIDGVVQAISRFCVEDTELGARVVRRGDVVVAMLGAANRDPAAFPQPDSAEVGRSSASPHLGFGHGSHACLGAHLATKVVLAALSALADRFTGLEPAAPVEQRPSATLRGPAKLPLRAVRAPT